MATARFVVLPKEEAPWPTAAWQSLCQLGANPRCRCGGRRGHAGSGRRGCLPINDIKLPIV